MGLTYISTSSVPHELMYIRTYMCRQQKSSHINDTQNKEVYTTQVQVSMSTVPMQQVCTERAQNASANNAGQPCQWPSHQIRRISRGTAPWTTDQNRLQGARLCVCHHQSQRGGPPSWGQGTQQRQDGRPQHTRERHFVLPAMNDRTSSQLITTCTYIHAWFVVDDSMHPYQTPCQGVYSIRTAIHTTYVRLQKYTTA